MSLSPLLHLRTNCPQRDIISWVLEKHPIIAVASDCFGSRIEIILRTKCDAG